MVCERPLARFARVSPSRVSPAGGASNITVRKKETRKQRTYGPSSLKEGDYIILPLREGESRRKAAGGRSHIILILELSNSPLPPCLHSSAAPRLFSFLLHVRQQHGY